MARIAGVDIPRDKRVDVSLRYIYGIGPTLSHNICDNARVEPATKVRDLTDDEINRIAFRALEGFEIDDERLAADAITRVGPGGNFVADEHTLKFLRGERYVPSLLYRNSREAWEASGARTFVERAKEKAMTILQEHRPNPLPEDVSKALDDLVSHALKSLEK